MFGKAKSSSHEKDEHLPSAPAVARFDTCKFGRVKFDGNLMHRSRHDSCR